MAKASGHEKPKESKKSKGKVKHIEITPAGKGGFIVKHREHAPMMSSPGGSAKYPGPSPTTTTPFESAPPAQEHVNDLMSRAAPDPNDPSGGMY